MPSPPPDPEHIARVGELFSENRTLREIAEIMRLPAPQGGGISISHETVRQWLIKWREAEAWRVAKEEAGKAAERELMAARHMAALERLARDGFDRMSPVGGGNYEQVAPIVLRILDAQARFLGLYAPTRVQVEGSVFGPVPDPQTAAILAAMEERARQQATADGDALLSGDEESP